MNSAFGVNDDLLDTDDSDDFDDDLVDTSDDLLEPMIDTEPFWWAKVIHDGLATLFAHKCIQYAEEWACAYVYLMLLFSSKEWRQLSLFVAKKGASVLLTLVCILVASGRPSQRDGGYLFELS